ncbi:deoxyribodipyrimidine photolyase-related protein [Methanomethylovorans hollandica DSM 15978]|uniref:Deoxyribodipyrimidine photolyase-related protein n=1 Tax=Methanomethylovorans hollandica (strain DSM 15978 / NBRC 107637 / DMS1) TaxID=867904 RepID=L0KX37_METHD|nr:cryptochrome/photolyase family protein [Methanomethylovorans hollandica]AGB50007.1 deoxyribodipyrimidine photolyase-related protein [Methanomethylovorans hollandica DSM 15978]
MPGNCLYSSTEQLKPDRHTLFFMAEDFGLCSRYRYHKHKLVLILSSMRSYRDMLLHEHAVTYFDITDGRPYEEKLLDILEEHGIKHVVTYELDDDLFASGIRQFCEQHGVRLEFVDNPGFLTNIREFKEYRDGRTKLLMNNFYIWQRKRLHILVDEGMTPAGGVWSLDYENRKKIPKGIQIPPIRFADWTAHTKEVTELVEQLFPENPGDVSNFYLPTTREASLDWMEDFLAERFRFFGPYEDAIAANEHFLFHSLLSPLINLGLLTPDEVVQRAIAYSKDNGDVPMSGLEGFVRQIIGWREFVRGMYHSSKLRGNFFENNGLLDERWYHGTLGIEPVDITIKKVMHKGYCHHIERLMILGNFMLLCGIHPDEVYRWFMELFVDAADWVMVPNVYGMSQFADGGSLATKPYISGSAYILKMSDYKKGRWCEIWDGLYWRFIDRHRDVLRNNFRMGMMIAAYDRMPEQRKDELIQAGEGFLSTISQKQ